MAPIPTPAPGPGPEPEPGSGSDRERAPAAHRAVLDEVGPRLRRLRARRNLTLAALSESTGISKSTLSRLESGQRRPSLELLLPLAAAYRVPLDDLVGAPEVGDPRVRLTPQKTPDGGTVVPLSSTPGPLQAYKVIVPDRGSEPDPRTHEGYEWLYVLHGRLRLVLGEHDLVLGPGEAAEFDTRVPHWFGAADGRPVEVLSLFGRQGERMHVRARPSRPGARA
ncbi:helix-turn-helix domain-containing protein [Actinacidiphila epipremni]|uniref:Helix-turn-helix transcriptional regulator n=1 Tax=Actinacidiphila epipremni TaxID=2053013 RepID=A0ABX0ZL27_9ACTN|nr:XRE family transcriptional regulator [Actinacidiphila epipremni]NJP44554.1 helix-turn-helix transcriptional regulator [Actinacidiphila epipremni]